MEKKQFAMGSGVKDTVTGFAGKVTAKCENLDGTLTYYVAGPVSDPARVPESAWFDSERLEVAA